MVSPAKYDVTVKFSHDMLSRETSTIIVKDALLVNTSKGDENKTAERLAFYLNFYKTKKVRLDLHKLFLKRCYDEKKFQMVHA